MKTLNTESNKTGQQMASVYDYQSGVLIGNVVADWSAYRLWAEGPSDVCHADKCLSAESLADLGIQGDTVIFLLE